MMPREPAWQLVWVVLWRIWPPPPAVFMDVFHAHLPPRRSGFNPRPGSLRIFAFRNRARQCRWSAGFLGDIPYPPPFNSGAAPYSPQSLSSALTKTTLLTAAQLSSLGIADRQRVAREVTSGREIYDCEYQAVKSAAGRLDYWSRCTGLVSHWLLHAAEASLLAGLQRLACRLPGANWRTASDAILLACAAVVRLCIHNYCVHSCAAFHQQNVECLHARLTTWRSGLNTRPGHRIFASGKRAVRCRWSEGFLGDLPLPPPPPATPFRHRSIFTSITLIGSQNLVVKSRPNLFTLFLTSRARDAIKFEIFSTRKSCRAGDFRRVDVTEVSLLIGWKIILFVSHPSRRVCRAAVIPALRALGICSRNADPHYRSKPNSDWPAE
ncbi:hypothetical protein PR048_027378 [Dryococelus australis]|uniref:Uncharacterized protein n=1 Tax=Dryococelus australis TaxID=614101 RepID=A0ABQ9GFA2_9NEOP|nr:hypothetical protein PR048_027378 [Dryococelus australis]